VRLVPLSGWEAGEGNFFCKGRFRFSDHARRQIMDIMNVVDTFSRTMGIHGNNVAERHVRENKESDHGSQFPAANMDVDEVVKNLNSITKNFNEKVQFSFHEKSNRIIIKVINSDTNEVVRQIPAKYSIKLLEHFQEHMGLFIDESR
jgi:flagellar protein FlaG